MDWKHGALFVILLQLGGFQITPGQVVASDEEGFFEKQVRPLLVERCHKCHTGKMSKGGLTYRLASRDYRLTDISGEVLSEVLA